MKKVDEGDGDEEDRDAENGDVSEMVMRKMVRAEGDHGKYLW